MEKNSFALKNAYELLKEYGLTKPSLDDLVYIVKSKGFDLIDFERNNINGSVSTLISELNLVDLARVSNAFVYMRGDIKLLFIDSNLTADEKRYAIAHELGHIVCRHLTNATVDHGLQDEYEANEFAHYLLHPSLITKTVLNLSHRGMNNGKPRSIFTVIIVLLLLIITILGIVSFRLWKSTGRVAENETFQMEMLDPLSYIDDGKIFGMEIDEYTADMEEAKDYSVSDVYQDGRVYVYTFHPTFRYFGIPEGDTGVRIFTESGEGITMVCYDFMIKSAETEQITDKLQAMVACIRQVYDRGYDYGLCYDPQNVKKYINFDDLLNCIKHRNNGKYSLTWALDNYAVSLDMNYDVNQEISLGSIRFYIPSKK